MGAHPVALSPPAGDRRRSSCCFKGRGALVRRSFVTPALPGANMPRDPGPRRVGSGSGALGPELRVVRSQRRHGLALGRDEIDAERGRRAEHPAGSRGIGHCERGAACGRAGRAGRSSQAPRASPSHCRSRERIRVERVADADVVLVDAEVADAACGFQRATVGFEHRDQRVRCGHTRSATPSGGVGNPRFGRLAGG